MHTSCDDILYGRLRLLQPINGPRVNLDTILLSSWVKFRSRHTRYLEAGCATGAISILLAMKFRNIHVTGIELQSELVDLAVRNAENNNLSDRVSFVAGDLRDRNILPREYFDVLVINPPYESEKRGRVSPDSMRSSARHELSCTPDDVGELAYRVLKSKGRVFSVFTSARLGVFMQAISAHRITPKRLRFVYPDGENESGIFLLEGIKDGGEGLCVLPPLFVRDSEGRYTPEVLQAYDLPGAGGRVVGRAGTPSGQPCNKEEKCTRY